MRGLSQKGFSSVQLIVALAIVSLMMLVAVPAFQTITNRSRVSSASRQIVSDIRDARGRSVSTGWECKIIGFGSTSTDPKKYQYRLLGRSSSGVSWPADTSPKLSSSTQLALAWVDLARLYPGVTLASPTARFEIAFDSRGAAPAASSFNPLVISKSGYSKSLTVSTVGSVRVQ